MKIRFNKDHLDFKEGNEYDVLEPTAIYLVGLKVAKEVVDKGGKAPDLTKKVKEEKAPVTTKELKTDIETK